MPGPVPAVGLVEVASGGANAAALEAAFPAATYAGSLARTDDGQLYFSDGAAWQAVLGGGSSSGGDSRGALAAMTRGYHGPWTGQDPVGG